MFDYAYIHCLGNGIHAMTLSITRNLGYVWFLKNLKENAKKRK